jgi:RNA polymerase sigma-70 factor, ECF subfamily
MSLTAADITGLLARVAVRDRDAFSALYDATSSKLYGIILRILRRRDIADEVLQEVFVKIWDRASDFDPSRASPITWMSTIARNRALDEVRRSKPLSIEDVPEAMDVASGDPHPLQALERTEALRALMACLEGLEPQRREIVLLAYLNGASREELSQRYGHPVATIKTWLHRSLSQLRGCLSQ